MQLLLKFLREVSGVQVTAKSSQKMATAVIWGAGAITVLILLVIVIYILIRGLPYITWDFLISAPQGGLSGEGGISTAIVATAFLISLTIALLIIPGIGTAIFLTEYARENWVTNPIRYAINTLAGVPSIVFGLFGFALFVTVLHFNFSILSGALTLVCLLLPTLICTTEEAIMAVPHYQREAGLALGATKWQTIAHVILPAALPGIVTGIILCVGRAIGETACLYVTMGGSAAMPTSLLAGGRTLALHVYYLATDTNAFDKAMATAAVLVILIVVINTLTNWLSQRFHARLTGRI
jgi:phosphate transport system permease protein